MKRYGYLFERICSLDNLRAAACNAAQGKRRRDEVQKFFADLESNLQEIRTELLCRTYRTLCALLALFRICVLLRQNESLLSPFTGAYSFSTHQLWDIRDGQNHILWNHHLDITGQQRALFPCFLFR